MSAATNRKIILAARPQGKLSLDGFRLEEEPVSPPADGQVLVAVDSISIDAFIRTTLEEGSYHQSVPVGGTVGALGVGRVLTSGSADFQEGDAVFAPLGAQTHATLPAGMLHKVDEKQAPITSWLGALGMTTGLHGLLRDSRGRGGQVRGDGGRFGGGWRRGFDGGPVGQDRRRARDRHRRWR